MPICLREADYAVLRVAADGSTWAKVFQEGKNLRLGRACLEHLRLLASNDSVFG
jgi:hypothetical protein